MEETWMAYSENPELELFLTSEEFLEYIDTQTETVCKNILNLLMIKHGVSVITIDEFKMALLTMISEYLCTELDTIPAPWEDLSGNIKGRLKKLGITEEQWNGR